MVETMAYDVLIVGGGPAGLAAAIRIKQLDPAHSVCLIDKGAEIGAHILSGAVMDPRALTELFPDWQGRNAPLGTPVTTDEFRLLTAKGSFTLPRAFIPACLHNKGHAIVSLGRVCRWLAAEADALGVEIYSGFAGAEVLHETAGPGKGSVKGVLTGERGRRRDGHPGPGFQSGMALHARFTLFAEGARGHLGKHLEAHFDLRRDSAPQHWALGIKELWEVPTRCHRPGHVVHTVGWPLPADTGGGGFCYHHGVGDAPNRIAIGLVIDLGYRNPWLSPFDEFQRFKMHPLFHPVLAGGRRLAYGARTLVTGGLQALPRLVFPGGALIGDDAGFLVAARLKGAHAAIKSGMLAAAAVHDALAAGRSGDELTAYATAVHDAWLHDELHAGRNVKPALARGLHRGLPLVAIDQIILRGRAPWTLALPPPRTRLPPAACLPIDYPKPDGLVSFDRASSVFLSNTHHDDDQPCHLRLKDAAAPPGIEHTRYCPAGVFEILDDASGTPRLRINAQNCLHCKACDIVDPAGNIDWSPPQGGEGPIYAQM